MAQVGLKILNGVVVRRPNDAEAHFARGSLLLEAGYSRDALAEYRKTVAIDPQHASAWESLASLARQRLMSPEEAQNAEFRLIRLSAGDAGAAQYLSPINLIAVADLSSAYRVLAKTLSGAPAEHTAPLFGLHRTPRSERAPMFPGFDRLSRRDRMIGFYFQRSPDIQSIAQLYHVTRYPFE